MCVVCVLLSSVVEQSVYVQERVVSIIWVAVSYDDSSSADSCITLKPALQQRQRV